MLNENHKEFVKLIMDAARTRSAVDVFGDAVHLMAQALWKPFALGAADEVEADWQRTRDRYTDDEYQSIAKAFAVVVRELERSRDEFLGICLEHIGAANTHNGQFLTPNSVARMMARCNMPEKTDGIITLSDPACGASVLLIAQAEEMLQNGIPQRNILIHAGDIDQRACDMSYIELSLLGYAAVVEHANALSLQRFSPPRYTAGYFLHAMPMRLHAERAKTAVEARDGIGAVNDSPEAEKPVERVFDAPMTQAVFNF